MLTLWCWGLDNSHIMMLEIDNARIMVLGVRQAHIMVLVFRPCSHYGAGD